LSAAAALAPPGRVEARDKIDFIESSCGPAGEEKGRVLVAYASKLGTTGGVADAIGKELCAAGFSADVRLMKNIDSISGYTAVVVGAAIHNFRWLPVARRFVYNHKRALVQVPTAYFLTCLQLAPGQPPIDIKGPPPKDETEEQKLERIKSYLDPVLRKAKEVEPVDIGLFAGALDYSALPKGMDRAAKALGFVEGDYRDFEAIKAWARKISPMLVKQ